MINLARQRKMLVMLQVNRVSFSYGKKNILNELSFKVLPGEITALIGLSGSGKTTLFRLMAGIISPTGGSITINGLTHPDSLQWITYMRQEDLLLPWRTVMDNLLLFTELGKGKKKRGALVEQALYLLQKVGLSDCENLYPKELSGGMRQRVALARTLLQDRPILLLDEPFASLDVIIREQLYGLLREIKGEFKKTMIMVTHDFRDALLLSDRIFILSNGTIKENFTLPQTIDARETISEQLIKQIRHSLSNTI